MAAHLAHHQHIIPRQTYSRPIRSATDNPATRNMHTEAADKRKDFLAARAMLKAELVKVMGDEITKTMAADQADGTIAGTSCVDCMNRLERRYGTLNSAHAKKLVATIQTRCERPSEFPMYYKKFNRAIRWLNRARAGRLNRAKRGLTTPRPSFPRLRLSNSTSWNPYSTFPSSPS